MTAHYVGHQSLPPAAHAHVALANAFPRVSRSPTPQSAAAEHLPHELRLRVVELRVRRARSSSATGVLVRPTCLGQKITRSPADPVVVVANFSDFATDTSVPSAEYVVPNWPGTPAGKRWRDVSQARDVPNEWIGREPIFPWEAKVYAIVDR